jgi:hypothetical protein
LLKKKLTDTSCNFFDQTESPELQNFILKWNEAEKDIDFVTIQYLLPCISHLLNRKHNALIFLCRFLMKNDECLLIRAIDSQKSFFITQFIFDCLPIEYPYDITNKVENIWFRYLVCTCENIRHISDIQVKEECEKNLYITLKKMTHEFGIWNNLIKVLNTYPASYPGIQRSLGRLLADAPRPILESYIETIKIHGIPFQSDFNPHQADSYSYMGINEINTCLDSLREVADSKQRILFLQLFYEKWKQFIQKTAIDESFTYHFFFTNIDTAVILFLIEFRNLETIEQELVLQKQKLNNFRNEWYNNHVNCLKQNSILMHEMYIYHSAGLKLNNDIDAIQNCTQYWLEKVICNDYLRILFSFSW